MSNPAFSSPAAAPAATSFPRWPWLANWSPATPPKCFSSAPSAAWKPGSFPRPASTSAPHRCRPAQKRLARHPPAHAAAICPAASSPASASFASFNPAWSSASADTHPARPWRPRYGSMFLPWPSSPTPCPASPIAWSASACRPRRSTFPPQPSGFDNCEVTGIPVRPEFFHSRSADWRRSSPARLRRLAGRAHLQYSPAAT